MRWLTRCDSGTGNRNPSLLSVGDRPRGTDVRRSSATPGFTSGAQVKVSHSAVAMTRILTSARSATTGCSSGCSSAPRAACRWRRPEFDAPRGRVARPDALAAAEHSHEYGSPGYGTALRIRREIRA